MSIMFLALNLSGCKLLPAKTPFVQKNPVNETVRAKITSARLNKLNAQSAWQKFKAFWKKLDAVSPKEKSGSEESADREYFGEYYRAIDETKINSLRIEMDEMLKNLKEISDKSLINGKEIDLLDKVSRERFHYMSWGLSSMVTRMAPSYFSLNRDESLKDLERKIDVLWTLKTDDAVSEKEFTAALENIQKDIEVFAILDLIDSDGSYYNPAFKYGETAKIILSPENYINAFEKTYLDYQKMMEAQNTEEALKNKESIEQKYQNIKKEIEETKAIFPSLKELIADLEQ